MEIEIKADNRKNKVRPVAEACSIGTHRHIQGNLQKRIIVVNRGITQSAWCFFITFMLT